MGEVQNLSPSSPPRLRDRQGTEPRGDLPAPMTFWRVMEDGEISVVNLSMAWLGSS